MTKSTAETVWSNCLKIIKDIVEWQHFKTWFEPIKAVELKGNVLLIQVPSQFFFEYLEEHYINLLAKTLKREMGKDALLEYRIMVDSGGKGVTEQWTYRAVMPKCIITMKWTSPLL